MVKCTLRSSAVAIGVLAVGMLIACQNGLTSDIAFLPMPTELPYARVENSGEGADGFQDYNFVLEWKRKAGILYRNMPLDEDEDVITALLEEVYAQWGLYVRLINPRPFYDDSAETGLAPTSDLDTDFDVFTPPPSPQLDNATGKAKIVIHRYWPKSISTRTEWLDPAAIAVRAVAFKKAAANITAMMEAIEESPFFTTAVPDYRPLLDLHQAMAASISYNPDLEDCGQRTKFTMNTAETAVILAPNAADPDDRSGFLYEYYLGHAPDPTTGYFDSSGSPSFPE